MIYIVIMLCIYDRLIDFFLFCELLIVYCYTGMADLGVRQKLLWFKPGTIFQFVGKFFGFNYK